MDATYTVALDVMGADKGPDEIIRGGVDAARNLGDKLKVIFVGHRDKIQAALAKIPDLPKNISFEHSETEVSMHVAATDALKMRDSSISVGAHLVKRKKADAFVSPGNTGAVMATSLLTLGRIEGVSRPAITALFPTEKGRPCVMLDCGANADCKPLHLQQFAVMGSVYSSIVFNQESPKVGLMSIGEERSKGNELIFETHERLKESKINFFGNIEGRDVLAGLEEAAQVCESNPFAPPICAKAIRELKEKRDDPDRDISRRKRPRFPPGRGRDLAKHHAVAADLVALV